MESSNAQQAIIKNLQDADCDSKVIERFLAYQESGDVKKQLQLLAHHRGELLSRVHKEEQRINCLDYLAYQIRKSEV